MDGKQNFIYIYSTKGGVGKTTSSINLTFQLNKKGFRVSLIDLDFGGPNISSFFQDNPLDRDISIKDFKVVPGLYKDIEIISIGFIMEKKDFNYYTGKYLQGLIYQIFHNNNNITGDFVIIDMPPGFDDIHREMFSTFPGEVLLITIPDKLAEDNISKGIFTLEKLNIKILGIVENMSSCLCPSCGNHISLFDSNEKDSYEGIKILERIPFEKDNKNFNKSRIVSEKFAKLSNEIIKLYEKG